MEQMKNAIDGIFKGYENSRIIQFQFSTVDVNRIQRDLACTLLKANTAPNAHNIIRCASVLAWCYVAGHLPEQLVIDHL